LFCSTEAEAEGVVCCNCCIGRVATVELEEVPWSGELIALNPSRFWNGFGDGRGGAFLDFDAVESVLDSTRLVFLLDIQLEPNNFCVHPSVWGGVFGFLLLFSGVDDMVLQKDSQFTFDIYCF